MLDCNCFQKKPFRDVIISLRKKEYSQHGFWILRIFFFFTKSRFVCIYSLVARWCITTPMYMGVIGCRFNQFKSSLIIQLLFSPSSEYSLWKWTRLIAMYIWVQGSISPTFYEQLLRSKIWKHKKSARLNCLYALLVSAGVKAACKMLMKVTPDMQWLNAVILYIFLPSGPLNY